jgi:hypothetical protein
VRIPRIRRAVLAAAVAVSAFGAAASALPAAHAATGASKPVLVQCTNRGSVKPRQFTITCADGNDFLSGLKWSSWASTASGKGTEWINTCNPNCAAGHFHKFGVKVYLWRVRPRPHVRGQRYYTRMTLTYVSKIPRGFHRHRTIDLWSHI